MKQVCKCHGVSGSCTMKICWKVLPEFRVIGDELMKSFDKALPVKSDKRKSQLKVKARSVRLQNRKVQKDDLVFMTKSINFCKRNTKFGLLGTTGRKCVRYSNIYHSSNNNNNSTTPFKKVESCGHLCCGRGFQTKVIEIEEDCDCQFQWCCSVKCKKCKKRILEYYCK